VSNTEQSLKEAFAGESQANRKYLAFARKADRMGSREWPNSSELLPRPRPSTRIIISRFSRVSNHPREPQASLWGEHYEFTEMYPQFIEKSKAEKQSAATKSFYWANEVEKVHGALYEDAIRALEAGASLPDRDYYVCEKCGCTIADAPTEKCPICGAKKESFFNAD